MSCREETDSWWSELPWFLVWDSMNLSGIEEMWEIAVSNIGSPKQCNLSKLERGTQNLREIRLGGLGVNDQLVVFDLY